MKIPKRIFVALTIITVAGVATGMGGPPASHGADKPPAKAKVAPPSKVESPKHIPKDDTQVHTKPAAHDEMHDGATRTPAIETLKPPASKAGARPAQVSVNDGESAHPTPPTPEQALKMLEDGNTRWVGDTESGRHLDAARRTETAENGQSPFASILTCADSRIPVEHVFDQGVGDLFVVRVAGNTAGAPETGSIEYGVEHLHTPVLVVLGHTKCGAVSAAATNAEVHGNIATLVKTIGPSVERAQKLNPSLMDKDLVPAAIRENVWQSVFDLLKSSEPCRTAVAKGELKIVGAVYDIASGKVEWMGEHPWQSQLIAAFAQEAGAPREAAVHPEHAGEHR
jgi:carbonic anhydrase